MRKFALILFLCVTGTAFAQQEVIIRGQDDKGVPRAVSTDTDGRMVGQVSVIDDCEVVPGWTALSNDTTGVETDLDHVMGAKSLEFDKVDGGDNLTVGGIQKTITALNLDFLVENGGAFGYSLNVSDTTDIDHCFLRLGTDASNYNEWRVEGTGLSVGWNSLRFNTNAPATDGATGDGWAPSVVTFIALGCNFNLETDALADIRVDHVIVHVGLQVAADINASVSSSDPAVANLTDIEGLLTSDNDAKELADYYDSTSQLKPFYVDDALLSLDNKGLANVMAAVYDLWGGVITAITQSVRMMEIDPAREWYLHDDVVTITNGVDATYNYYLSMDGHRYHSMHFTLNGGSGVVTLKIYCTNQSGIAPAACAYQDYSNKAFGQANWIATGATVDNTMKFAGCTYIKYEVVAATGGANDADWELDASRWW